LSKLTGAKETKNDTNISFVHHTLSPELCFSSWRPYTAQNNRKQVSLD